MKQYLVAILMVCSYTSFSQTNSYESAWKSLNENKRADAEKFLQQAMGNPSTYEDAFITDLYLKTYNREEDEVTNFVDAFYKKSTNPYPYIYALWPNKALVGSLGKKTMDNEISLIKDLAADKNAPGTLVAAANFNEEMNHLFSGEFGKMESFSDAIGNVKEWQFTGLLKIFHKAVFIKIMARWSILNQELYLNLFLMQI